MTGATAAPAPRGAGGAPATQPERTEASRRALIDATIALLAREGYRAASVARIQEESGLSRGLVNYHFGSKLKLMEAVVERIRTAYKDQTVGEHGRETMTGLEQVLEMFGSYLNRMVVRPEGSRVMLVLATESVSDAPEVRSAVQEAYTGLRETMIEMLRAGIADGTVRADLDPVGHAAVLAAVLRGTALQYFVDPDGFDLDGTRAAALAMLERDLSADRGSRRPPPPRR
ncbi:TetR/AcrR family transcriptional regulator [Pseudonocardia kunmingensis]|uniref:TetR family transcriptional regulator n=1 Tax=Pseudonocardia kunmingensis TaxID=630975 RepID=A0A543CXU8_9PSEU|nr:TetR/AcrR family transcriptional regulator [Pseudonocardia kunmingensis]TQM01937.1 TetR family transcriptional regulator [Pseudonocardia kunmingensis]